MKKQISIPLKPVENEEERNLKLDRMIKEIDELDNERTIRTTNISRETDPDYKFNCKKTAVQAVRPTKLNLISEQTKAGWYWQSADCKDKAEAHTPRVLRKDSKGAVTPKSIELKKICKECKPLKASARKFLEKRAEYNKASKSLEHTTAEGGEKKRDQNNKMIAELVKKSIERVLLDRPYLMTEKTAVIITEQLPHKLALLFRKKRYQMGLRETLLNLRKNRLLLNRLQKQVYKKLVLHLSLPDRTTDTQLSPESLNLEVQPEEIRMAVCL